MYFFLGKYEERGFHVDVETAAEDMFDHSCIAGRGLVWLPVPWLHLQEHEACRETKESEVMEWAGNVHAI